MMALCAHWQAPRERGMSIWGRGPGQKKDTLLTLQVGPAAGCIGVGEDVAGTQSQSSAVHTVICLGTEWPFQFVFMLN